MKRHEPMIVALYCLGAGATLGFTFAQMIKVPSLCSATDTHCIREWLVALGGWAAFLAAVLTVFALNRQIQTSNRQHREHMKFQAYEKLMLIQQVGRAATNAYGTIVQVFHEFDAEKTARSKDRLSREVDAAAFALDILLSSQMPEKRMQIQGDIPHASARADVALQKFVKIGREALEIVDDQFEGEIGRRYVRASSGELVTAYLDLQNLDRQMRELQDRWRHLSV